MIRNCLVVLMRGHFRCGGDLMLKMMGGSPDEHDHPACHVHGGAEPHALVTGP